jgi:hypothetical protein
VPDVEKIYVINNTCTDAVQVANSTGSNVSVPAGKTMWVYSTGTNVVDAVTHLSSLTLSTPLPVSSGGTGSNTGTNLQSAVSGVLPIANGGTGSATAAFNGSGITNLNATAISSGVIANTYTTANATNSSDTIVARDTGGNFSANTITANLTGNVTGNVTGNITQNYINAQEQQATGVNAGSAVAATWNGRSLNTLATNTISGAVLSGGGINLPDGTYYISASAPTYAVNGHKIRILNANTNTPLLVGTSEFMANTVGGSPRSFASGRITLSGGPTNIRLDHYTQAGRTGNGLGTPVNASGYVEVYGIVEIWKLA